MEKTYDRNQRRQPACRSLRSLGENCRRRKLDGRQRLDLEQVKARNPRCLQGMPRSSARQISAVWAVGKLGGNLLRQFSGGVDHLGVVSALHKIGIDAGTINDAARVVPARLVLL